MATNTLKRGSGKELKQLFAQLTAAIGDTLGSLVAREIVVKPGEAEVMDVETLLAALPRPCAVARGALDKAFAGKALHALLEVPDAISMAGLLMMTPEDIIAARRQKGALVGEDAEAFGELGNVLCSGLAGVLREQVADVDLRYQDHGLVEPGVDSNGILGSEMLMVFAFRMKIGGYPESSGALVIDFATAEAWNKAPLELAAGAPPAPGSGPAGATAAARSDDDALESIPAAPVRGTLAAFVLLPEVFRMLRRSCRRVGFDLRRHGRAEIPNPAAHRNELVLIDVPAGEDRRFDWCRRIKEFSNSTKVVLVIHHPSRQRVAQAFLSRADAILGFPCDEMQLAQKLATLLPDDSPGA